MKIAIDIDGVLADFSRGFHNLLANLHGEKRPYSYQEITEWNWYESILGYTKEEGAKAWEYIKANPDFWYELNHLAEFGRETAFRINYAARKHQVYFVTSRVPDGALYMSHMWLRSKSITVPNVILAGFGEKPEILEALKIDVLIDDNLDTVYDTARRSIRGTRVYLKDAPYNQDNEGWSLVNIARVKDINEMLDREGL